MSLKLTLYSFFLMLLLSGCTGTGQKGIKSSDTKPADTGKAVISFTEYEHNFGRVNEGEKIGCIFNFRNTGCRLKKVSGASA